MDDLDREFREIIESGIADEAYEGLDAQIAKVRVWKVEFAERNGRPAVLLDLIRQMRHDVPTANPKVIAVLCASMWRQMEAEDG